MAHVFTIGYASDHFEGLMARLEPWGITHLVDVRTNAWSRYQEDFRGEAFAARVQEAGLRYIFMGDRIGGKPDVPEVLTDGEVDYAKLREAAWFLEGIDKLLLAARDPNKRICLMCGCGKPEECHRGRLLCEILAERGCSSTHILPDGRTVDQLAVRLKLGHDQLALFE